MPYFSAHLFGASGPGMLNLVTALAQATKTDTEHGIQAAVDDESHLNRCVCAARRAKAAAAICTITRPT